MNERREDKPAATSTKPRRRRARTGSRESRGDFARILDRLGRGAQNAAELMRLGRLSAPYHAAFDVVREEKTFRLRHYALRSTNAAEPAKTSDSRLGPVLLVPPLMVASEVYDISPELSSVQQLMQAGLDVWLTDFGAPEREEGGMNRTLDDHIRAVSQSIDDVVQATGKDVHLAGYSQGGMFCYQVAAYRASKGIASLITFGSPVDIRRNLPISSRITERIIDVTRTVLERPLEAIDGLPGFITATGFKLLSVRKEVQQLTDFVASLHDREKLAARESRRRFLGGEGFVAWPGPAFRTFVDEFIVGNRMASGGFVIEGRTVTLADVTSPILYFVGSKDEIAKPEAVRAIERAAIRADTFEVPVRAGHFGLVVGSTATKVTWPTVIEWVKWRDAQEAMPTLLADAEEATTSTRTEVDDTGFDDASLDVEIFYDIAASALDGIAKRASTYGREMTDLFDKLRWQVPRLQKLRSVTSDTAISMGLALAEQAQTIPEHTFFVWKGRAFTYKQADQRVDAVMRGLVHIGVQRGEKIGVLMEARPSYLSIVTALSRVGAVAVLLSPATSRVSLSDAIRISGLTRIITDPENALTAHTTFQGSVLVLGGGPPGTHDRPSIPDGCVDMEAINPANVTLPLGFVANDARARELAMIIFAAGRDEKPRAARITNRRWAFSALGAAAGCALTSSDTVYCCLPLHHAAGMLVAAGGALVGGSRLAVADGFDRERFLEDVHRSGASVVFYAGEMLRPLVDGPPNVLDQNLPVRLFAGSGMRTDLWKKLRDRYPRTKVLEFYASTEGNAVLANARGQKVGSLGKPLPGSADLALASWDFAGKRVHRDGNTVMMCGTNETGLLLARVDPTHPMTSFDGYEGDERQDAQDARVLRDVFEKGDAWFVTGDLMRRDEDGDYWFVDRANDVLMHHGAPLPTLEVEDALLKVARIRRAAVVGHGETLVTFVVGTPPVESDLQAFTESLRSHLPLAASPDTIHWVEALPSTDGFRTQKRVLRESIALPSQSVHVLATSKLEGETYVSAP